MMQYHVKISYSSRESGLPAAWLKKNGAIYKCTSVMDDSAIGMSFLYSFESAEDADAFRLTFQ